MTVKSIKHNKNKRVLIPSREEAGAEAASPKVQAGKDKAEYPVNPVVHRGRDPELFWMHKYGKDDRADRLNVDIRSLYRHEHVAPEKIIQRLYQLKEVPDAQQTFINGLFGNGLKLDEIDKVSEYYKHADDWTNRMIQGDSLLVMTSLLEREGMAGKVQMIYIDPPYGIKYGSNWQMKLNNRNIKDGADEDLSGEPEQIKAYRDTWELGIHSYLSYLRDRLIIASQLLTESGSCFVQISDENVHLVRCLMDEVFGSENFCSLICFSKTGGQAGFPLTSHYDYLIWYTRNKENLKFRPLYTDKLNDVGGYDWIEKNDGSRRKLNREEKDDLEAAANRGQLFALGPLYSEGATQKGGFDIKFDDRTFKVPAGRHWKTSEEGIRKLIGANRLWSPGSDLRFVRYMADFPVQTISAVWHDTSTGGYREQRDYVVQTATKVIQRCVLMTTDPGDLVLDPTCGSGTTAFVAEQWGRRWITTDTSRIALNIAKTRLLTATFPYFKLYDENSADIRQGFIYKKVPHITLKSIANDEPPEDETLYDQPEINRKKLRVSGPFTVETLQNFEPVAPEELDKTVPDTDELENFEERIFEHMKSAGVKNGIRNEQALFIRVDRLNSAYLHAEGFYSGKRSEAGCRKSEVRDQRSDGKDEMVEKKAYIHIGPKFGTVSRQAVNEAVKECRTRGDADWLIILGFSFESNIENQNVTTSMGSFEVTKVRMHDDLMQDGLLKRDKKAASFVTIGEPDISVVSDEWIVTSNGKEIMPYGEFKELSGLGSLEEINGLGRESISGDKGIPKRRTIRTDKSNAKGGGFDSIEHRRRAIEELHRRVSAIPGRGERVAVGTGNAKRAGRKTEIPGGEESTGTVRGNIADAERSRQVAEIQALTADDLPLTTRHYSQATIRGLDIYDPVTDEVKARDVADIAYWMVDDDYDGSNFIVRQVFFCGGDKDEFAKWQKGLSGLAVTSAKRQAEKTLKIKIADDAFARLYGHKSHPIEIKKKGRKIAVRVISQFGEECTKVLEA